MTTKPNTVSDLASDEPLWATASFLGVLPAECRREIVALAVPVPVKAGQYLYEPELSIVDHGVVRAYVTYSGGRQVTVSYVRRAGAVGLMHLLGREYPAGFQAVTSGRLQKVDRSQLCESAAKHPLLGWSAAAEVTRRVDEMLAELTRVAFGSLLQRTAHHLLALTAELDSSGRPVSVRQADIALAVGVARESAARTIGRLAADGWVETGSRGVTVVDADGLRGIADART